MEQKQKSLRVAVIGPCASGKSTLVSVLRGAGYEARHVAQEHSYVPNMWKRISQPDVLIYLDVTIEVISARRPRLDFRQKHLDEQNQRLAHAREHCDLYLDTSEQSPAELQARALSFLADW